MNFYKENLYLIIPLFFFSFWAFHCFYYFNTIGYKKIWELGESDFSVFYNAGKKILKNPADLYKVSRFLYMPSFAIFFAFTFSLLPLQISYNTFYFINYISGMFAILEFNRILILMDVKKKAHRFIFLTIISNGNLLWIIFYLNHFKFIVFLILLFIIRREILYRKEDKEKDSQYYILTYGLFIFMLGMAPYFIFLLFIYVFQEIKLKDLIKKESLKIYLIIVIWFMIQNITFILYPSQFFEFLKGFYRPTYQFLGAYPLYFKDFIIMTPSQMKVIVFVFTGILVIITVILILIRNQNIENKFSLFLLANLFFGIISFPPLIAYICFSFVLFLFVQFLEQDVRGFEFIKNNSILLIGLISIWVIAFSTYDFLGIFSRLIRAIDLRLLYIYRFRLLILHVIMLYCIFILYNKRYNILKRVKKPDFELDKKTDEMRNKIQIPENSDLS